MANPVVLDFHNCLLRKYDMRLLEPPNWLNDNLINFAFEYFEYNAFAQHSDKVAFVGPDTVQFLKLGSEDDIIPCIQSLNLPNKQLIFFAINDSSRETDSGSHWSTLVFRRASGSFEHYDSYSSSNRCAAQAVARIVCDHIGVLEVPSTGPEDSCRFSEMPCPQQMNGFDCGMYVVCITEHIANHILNGKKVAMESMITPKTVKEARGLWKKKILELAGESK